MRPSHVNVLRLIVLAQSLALTSCSVTGTLANIPWWAWLIIVLCVVVIFVLAIFFLPWEAIGAFIGALLIAIGEAIVGVIEIIISIWTEYMWVFIRWIWTEYILAFIRGLPPALKESFWALYEIIGTELTALWSWFHRVVLNRLFGVLLWIIANPLKTVVITLLGFWGPVEKFWNRLGKVYDFVHDFISSSKYD
jgi:hypothetical protein